MLYFTICIWSLLHGINMATLVAEVDLKTDRIQVSQSLFAHFCFNICQNFRVMMKEAQLMAEGVLQVNLGLPDHDLTSKKMRTMKMMMTIICSLKGAQLLARTQRAASSEITK